MIYYVGYFLKEENKRLDKKRCFEVLLYVWFWWRVLEVGEREDVLIIEELRVSRVYNFRVCYIFGIF